MDTQWGDVGALEASAEPAPPPAPPAEKPRPWTKSQKWLAGSIIVLGLGLTGTAFTMIYFTVTHLLRSSMGQWAWTVVASGEAAFLFLFLTGVLLALRKAPAGALRGLLMLALFVGSVLLNVYASRHSLPGAAGHILIVVCFFGCLLTGKATLLCLLGGKVRSDRITFGEWVAHPVHSLRLKRWMITWAEPSRKKAHARYMALLFAKALAQADNRIGHQRFTWKRSLPVTLKYQLDMGQFPATVEEAVASPDGGWQEAVQRHVASELALLPSRQAQGSHRRSPQGSARGSLQGSSGGSAPDSGGSPEGSLEGIAEGSPGGSPRGSRGSSPEGRAEKRDWPETSDVEPAVLARMIRQAAERWEGEHGGQRLPAVQLSTAIKVRMSRDTAGKLLRQHCYPAPVGEGLGPVGEGSR